MKTLLAIINEPKESKDFIRYVAGMAINLMGKVHVLHLQTQTNYPYGSVDLSGRASLQTQRAMENFVEESKKVLKKYIEEVTQEISNNVFFDFSSEIGITSVRANELVSDNKVDMVVLEGQQNESFWTQTSSNIDVIREVECPVWIIPKNAIYRPFTEIIYATDYKEEDIENLKKLIRLFPNLLPNITALHITDSYDFEERIKKAGFVEMLQTKMAYSRLKVKAFYQNKHEDLAKLINEFALKNRADLIVVLKENKSFFERIFKSNYTKEIIKKSDMPVLVYHEKK